MNAYYVYISGFGLPHSGFFFLVCLKFSDVTVQFKFYLLILFLCSSLEQFRSFPSTVCVLIGFLKGFIHFPFDDLYYTDNNIWRSFLYALGMLEYSWHSVVGLLDSSGDILFCYLILFLCWWLDNVSIEKIVILSANISSCPFGWMFCF